MIYHTAAPTGWMLWIKYGLLKVRPLITMAEIYDKHLESPGTKAYSLAEARDLAKKFSHVDCSVQLGFGDLLEGDVGARHRGAMLTIAKAIYPRFLIRNLAKVFPIGLYLLVTARK